MMNSFLDIFGHSDIVIRGKHAKMMEEMKTTLSLKYIDIFITALQLGLMDGKAVDYDMTEKNVVRITRPSLLRYEAKLNAVTEASLLYLCEGSDINEKANNYIEVLNSNKAIHRYREKLMRTILGGIEEFYTLVGSDIECDMKIN